MEKIYDRKLVEEYLKQTSYEESMSSFREKMWIVRYSKGELVSSPLQKEELFQIVIRGELHVYCIRDDGSMYSISSGQHNYLLGDMDVFSDRANAVYAQADTDLICLAFSLEENKAELLDNIQFLRLICRSLTRKMQMLTTFDAAPVSLRERVLTYMRYRCSNNELRGVGQAAFCLHCSSRQLQRILNQYEKEGIVMENHSQKVFAIDKVRDLLIASQFEVKVYEDFIKDEKVLFIGEKK